MAQGAPTPPVPTRRMREAARRSDEVFIEAEIPFAGIGKQGDDVFAGAELARHFERDVNGGARADAHQETLFSSEGDFGVVGIAIADDADLVHDLAIEVLGDEARGESLNLGRPPLTAGQLRGALRLDGDDARLAPFAAQRRADAADRSPRSHAGDEG